jgi:hypothetical protein
MGATYKEPKLDPAKAADAGQGCFDFFLPGRDPQLTPELVSRYTGWSTFFVYDMVNAGKLEAFRVQDRKFSRMRISRRSVILLLAEMANFEPHEMVERLAEVAATLTKDHYAAFLQKAANLRAKV